MSYNYPAEQKPQPQPPAPVQLYNQGYVQQGPPPPLPPAQPQAMAFPPPQQQQYYYQAPPPPPPQYMSQMPGTGSQVQQLILPTNLDNYIGPTMFHCTFCNHQAVSTVKIIPGSGTYQACCLLCCCTCFLCPLPFCLEKCQDKTHFCPICGAQVGFKQYRLC